MRSTVLVFGEAQRRCGQEIVEMHVVLVVLVHLRARKGKGVLGQIEIRRSTKGCGLLRGVTCCLAVLACPRIAGCSREHSRNQEYWVNVY